MFKPGDVFFTKRAKRSSKKDGKSLITQGHFFGVMLGQVPAFAKDPPPEHLVRLMGTIGYITFDDVAEFLGDEFGQKCVDMFTDKYYGKEIPSEEVKADLKLVDSTGEPLST